MRFQASVGNTTYILEEQSDRRFVKLTRFNSTELKTFEFFVPIGLVVEYAVARLTPLIGRMLNQISKET